MTIAYLKKMNVYQIARELCDNHDCDPDVAIVAAWWVHHKEPPKNWSHFLNSALSKFKQIKTRPISKLHAKLILDNYKENQLLRKTQSLFI